MFSSFPDLPIGDNREVLQEKKNIAKFLPHPSLCQSVLDLKHLLVVDEPQAESSTTENFIGLNHICSTIDNHWKTMMASKETSATLYAIMNHPSKHF